MKIFVAISMLAYLSAGSQEIPPALQNQMEVATEANESEAGEDDQILQQLGYFKKHPLNLNEADRGDLQSLGLLSEFQVMQFIQYRNLAGRLIDKYELQSIPSWDVASIKKILPFVIVGPSRSLKENLTDRLNGDQYNLLRIYRKFQPGPGNSASYPGDPFQLMVRYRYQYKNLLYWGLTGEKDAGEQFFRGAQSKGFDFYSLHFYARNIGKVRVLAIGDYMVNLGQGLLLWQSYSLGKGAEVMSIKKQAPDLLPYRSSGEYLFNRGLAFTIGIRNWEASFFFSRKRISGNVVSDSLKSFSSISSSGYHRTPGEAADRNRIGQQMAGIRLTTRRGSFKGGLNSVINRFSLPYNKQWEPYNYFVFRGKVLFLASVDYSYTYKNLHLFGEAATDGSLQKAFLSGALVSLDPRLDMSLVYRDCSPSFPSLFGNAFTESSLPSNEKGIYAGLSLRPVTGWQISIYLDQFYFPWLRYRMNSPVWGHEFGIQVYYQPRKSVELYVRYRSKNKPVNRITGDRLAYPAGQVKNGLRFQLTSQLNRQWQVKNRFEWIGIKDGRDESGFLAFLEGQGKLSRRISTGVRLQYFETGSWESRIYAYEGDVQYSFSIPAFYGKGFRHYINMQFNAGEAWSFWVRWDRTVQLLANGTTGMPVNFPGVENGLRLQIQFRF